ncbi:MAG: DUF4870 domain-containing protein, partial [Bacteroidales bacterium]|nr:DUF4870 domain-containing protein [Bacteroidales bacterium]
AETSGLSLRTIQRIENGETIPRGDSLKRLSCALRVLTDENIDFRGAEDKSLILMLNLSQLGFLLFPLLGIILPSILWTLKKDEVNHVNEMGKSILNFQISWCALLFFIYITMVAGFFFHIQIFIPWRGMIGMIIFIGVLYLFNVVVIIVNTIRFQYSKTVCYRPAIHFFK